MKFFSLIVLILTPFLGKSQSTTYQVINTLDTGVGSLRESINAANSTTNGVDTIRFDGINFSGNVDLILESELFISDSLVIIGPQNRNLRIIPFTGGIRLIKQDTLSFLSLNNLQLAYAYIDQNPVNDVGGAINSKGTLKINNCYFESNFALFGGAIFALGETEITNTSFRGNVSDYSGGAIYSDENLILRNCYFESNFTTLINSAGGAVLFAGNLNHVESCTFNDNYSGSASLDGIAVTDTIILGNSIFFYSPLRLGNIFNSNPGYLISEDYNSSTDNTYSLSQPNDIIDALISMDYTYNPNINLDAFPVLDIVSGVNTGNPNLLYTDFYGRLPVCQRDRGAVENVFTVLPLNDIEFCGADSINVLAEPTHGTVTWYDSPINGTVLSNSDSLNLFVASSGSYYAEVTYLGCSNPNRIELVVISNPLPNPIVNYLGDSILSSTVGSTYQWIDCGSGLAISGATNQNLQVSLNGSYAVIVTNSDGCSDTSDCIMISDLEINESKLNSLNIYPNPAKNTLTIQGVETILNYKIIESSGKILLDEEFSTDYKIDISSIKSGIYIIQISSNEGVINLRFVKE